VPNAALVPALLAAAGCKLTDIGHVWQPSDDVKKAARAAGLQKGSPAYPRALSWLEHAARAAAGCAEAFDAHYKPFDEEEVLLEWAERVIESHYDEYEDWLQTEEGKEPRFAVFQESAPPLECARALWEWARVRKCWPWEQPWNSMRDFMQDMLAALPPEERRAKMASYDAGTLEMMESDAAKRARRDEGGSSCDEEEEEEEEDYLLGGGEEAEEEEE
jgi:hypothetical protein